MASLTPSPFMQFMDANGEPLVAGKLYTYASGTTTPLATYTDATGTVPNTNPVILDTTGSAAVWLGTSLYTFVLKTSTDTLVWTSDAVGGTVTSSTYNAFVAALAASGGSDLIGYTSTLTVQDKLQQYLSVKDYGAIGNGTANDTSAVNTAIATATAAGRALYFPAGTYLVSQITALVGMKLVGESSLTTIIKAKGSSNVDLVTSPSTTIDDVWIESIRFDGNSAGNTAGDTLVIKGHRPTLIDLVVIDSAANAIVTDWAGPSFRTAGSEGYFSHITIDSPQKSGWLHSGPSDSYFEDIIIIDPGQKTTASYYGLYLDPTGSGSNGRFNNLHHWTRSNAAKIALTGVYVGFGGNTFTNCHFEGGNLPLNIASNFNTFAACAYYAPRTGYAVNISATSSANYLDGALGLTFYSGNANYTGVNLAGAGNTLNLTAGGAITAINFGDSATGSNFVRINGYIDAGGAAYTGTQAADDDILIQIAGAGGGSLYQNSENSMFLASQSVAQALVAGAWTVIDCPNLSFDMNQEYTTGTSTWTCKIAGVYQFSAGMFFTSNTANIKSVGLLKNGSVIVSLQYFSEAKQAQLSGTSPPIYVAVGDTIQATYFSGLVDVSIPGQAYVYFGGNRIK